MGLEVIFKETAYCSLFMTHPKGKAFNRENYMKFKTIYLSLHIRNDFHKALYKLPR